MLLCIAENVHEFLEVFGDVLLLQLVVDLNVFIKEQLFRLLAIDHCSFVTQANNILNSLLNVETLNCLKIKKEAKNILKCLLRISSQVLKPDEKSGCLSFNVVIHHFMVQ